MKTATLIYLPQSRSTARFAFLAFGLLAGFVASVAMVLAFAVAFAVALAPPQRQQVPKRP